MSVIEYQREFIRLSKYDSEMLVNKEEMCRKFEDGLNDYIWAYVTSFGYDDFSKIMTCALKVERVKKKEYDRKEEDRVRKTLVSQVRISTKIRSLEVHGVLLSLHYRD